MEYSIFISLFVPGPKVFATEADYHEFDGYSEEVLALAIVMTAFVALVIGKNKILFQLWNFLHDKLSYSPKDDLLNRPYLLNKNIHQGGQKCQFMDGPYFCI